MRKGILWNSCRYCQDWDCTLYCMVLSNSVIHCISLFYYDIGMMKGGVYDTVLYGVLIRFAGLKVALNQ
jgi:hypothetical protein